MTRMVRCPFCLVVLDARGLPPGHVLNCPGCAKPVTVPVRRQGFRPYLIAGFGLGLAVGVLLTLGTLRLFRPSSPAALLAESAPLEAQKARPPAEEAPHPSRIAPDLSADEAAAALLEEFGSGRFSMQREPPWLIAFERGRYSEQQILPLYKRALGSLFTSFLREFESLHLPRPDRTLPVIVFNGRDSFDDYCRTRRNATMPPNVTGFYEPVRRRTVTYLEGFLPMERMLHEGAHQLVHHYSSAPLSSFWFHEGVGGAFETYERTKDGSFETVVAEPQVNRDRLYEALRAINDPEIQSKVSPRQILAMGMDHFRSWWDDQTREIARVRYLDPEETMRREAYFDRLANAYYAVSWALVYFQMRSKDPDLKPVLAEYFTAETRGRGGIVTFERILRERANIDLDRFQESFLRYLQDLK